MKDKKLTPKENNLKKLTLYLQELKKNGGHKNK